MTASGAREIERKYDVPDAAVLPDLTAAVPGLLADAPHTFELAATYLDTADGDLARARTALRRREGGHDAGWHIKADTPQGRFETQWPLDEPVDSASSSSIDEASAAAAVGSATNGYSADATPVVIPEVIRTELATRLGLDDAIFAPIAILRTTRTIVTLRDSDGNVRVEIADDTVIAHDVSADITRTWREWEAEFLPLPGATANDEAAEAEANTLLGAVEARLAEAGAVAASSHSKIARALGR
ncbi:CYTH domain-containing protein [Mycetocola lacteus]|uniref:CYTH domain-containing protein n=1 Tax=Mycetocola lacteus TaxID=76637 RepID=A0A3L7AK48_9MICO|nr:CYTH domain-containing protein [Mycetocola lacteus]RLP80789.1 CYTH domain-containing protein [Mycetocola lacteus]RLP84574.1 CYTH domain-containing protein [Mycetocola lacteus]